MSRKRIMIVSEVRSLREVLQSELNTTDFDGEITALNFVDLSSVKHNVSPALLFVSALSQDGVGFVLEFRSAFPAVNVGVLALNDRDEEFIAWAGIGISGYIESEMPAPVIANIILRLAAGEVIFPNRLSSLLLRHFARRNEHSNVHFVLKQLTRRETDVLELVADGMSNKQIARSLAITDATVKNHVHNILEKLGLNSRGEAAAAYRRFVLSTGPVDLKTDMKGVHGLAARTQFGSGRSQT